MTTGTKRTRYNRADINSTMQAAIRVSKGTTVYVYATGLGYTIDSEPHPFGNKTYKITDGTVTRMWLA